MRIKSFCVGAALLALCASVCSAGSLQDIISDYDIARQLHDLVGFNVQVADEVYDTGIPHLPTATIKPGVPLVRAFTQGNKDSGIAGFDAVKWVGNEVQPLGAVRFNLEQSPALWFGLQYQGNKVNAVLTVQDIHDKINTWDFVYAFDQNQSKSTAQLADSKLPGADPNWQGNYLGDGQGGYLPIEAPELEEDIWLKARQILVSPAALSLLTNQTADDVKTTVAGLPEYTGAEDPFTVAVKKTFYMDDTIFMDYPDGSAFYSGKPAPGAPELARYWVHLPGRTYFDPYDPGNPYPPLPAPGNTTLEFSNNGTASSGDWAGFVVVDQNRNLVNYSQYAAWGYLLEVEGLYDNAGPEEVYIINFEEAPRIIPEPVTALAFVVGLGGLGAYLRRRF